MSSPKPQVTVYLAGIGVTWGMGCARIDARSCMKHGHRGRILIIVQNLPVPFDRRVWLECGTLTDAGYQVAVVCPKGPGDPSYAVMDGVELYKYRAYAPGGLQGVVRGRVPLLRSWPRCGSPSRRPDTGGSTSSRAATRPTSSGPSACCSASCTGRGSSSTTMTCAPRPTSSAFPSGPRLIHKALLFLERCTTRCADHVISTNDSYRAIAIERNGVDPDDVTVVRTGPDPERLKPIAPDPALLRGREHLVAYIGVMAPQDGVDIVLEVADAIVNRPGPTRRRLRPHRLG